MFVTGMSWKITQVKQKLTWLTYVKSKEDNPLGLVPSDISLHDHPLWGLYKHFLLLGRILVSKWGLRPNPKVQTFAPHTTYSQRTIKHHHMSLSKKQPKAFPCIPQNIQKNPSFSPTWIYKQPASIAATPSLQPFRAPKIEPKQPREIHSFSSPKTEQKKYKKASSFFTYPKPHKVTIKHSQNPIQQPFSNEPKTSKGNSSAQKHRKLHLFSIILEFCTKFGQIFSPDKSKLFFPKNTPQ